MVGLYTARRLVVRRIPLAALERLEIAGGLGGGDARELRVAVEQRAAVKRCEQPLVLKANFAFVTPTTHDGETVTRFAIINPRTSGTDIATILDTMA